MKLEWKLCLKVGISLFLLYLCIHFLPDVTGFLSALLSAAAPLLVGCVIAYLVNILMSMYERHYFPRTNRRFLNRSRRPVCMMAAYVTLLAIVALVVGLVVPQLISCVQLILSELPEAIRTAVSWMEKWGLIPENIREFLDSIDWKSKIGQILSFLTSGIGDVMDILISTISSVFSGVASVFIGVIFSAYLLISRDKLHSQCVRLMNRYMKKSWYEKTMHVLSVLNDCFRRYIVGQCTEAVILGVLCTLGMLILRLPYATMIGALVAFTALIPVAGAYIGAIVGAFMILTVSPVKALIFLLFLIILQQLEGNLIYPRVVGSSMGLPGIWVLAAVTVGGGMMGIAGMLIGVPLAAAAYRFLREDVRRPEKQAASAPAEKKKQEENPESAENGESGA